MFLKKMFLAIVVVSTALYAGRTFALEQGGGGPEDLLSSTDQSIEQRMSNSRIVGLAAAIIVNKKIVWQKGYGFADKERAVPFTADTVMNIGSISKTITGAALMRAVQDGKLSLDENVNRYLPFQVANPRFPDAPITLRQLATHTSSITDRGSVYAGAYHFGRDSPEALGDFLHDYFAPGAKNYSAENFISSKPGAHRDYSNIGAALAGYIVERAVGEKLNVHTKRMIFTPLGMTNTGWFLSEVDLSKHSHLYIAQGLAVPIQLYGLTTYPDGGLRTSVENLSRFFVALLNDGVYEGLRILDKRSVNEMTRLQFNAANKPDNVELSGEHAMNSGVFWETKRTLTRFGHNGVDPGVVTMMQCDVDKDIGVVLFVNTAVPQEDGDVYGAIFDDLWQLGDAMKRQPFFGVDIKGVLTSPPRE